MNPMFEHLEDDELNNRLASLLWEQTQLPDCGDHDDGEWDEIEQEVRSVRIELTARDKRK